MEDLNLQTPGWSPAYFLWSISDQGSDFSSLVFKAGRSEDRPIWSPNVLDKMEVNTVVTVCVSSPSQPRDTNEERAVVQMGLPYISKGGIILSTILP